MKRVRNHALRNQRRRLAKLLMRRADDGGVLNDLRVVGSEREGFRLGGFIGPQGYEGTVFVEFGQRYDRQKDAVSAGEQSFGQKAKKLLRPSHERHAA
jgi:hypothetical protein